MAQNGSSKKCHRQGLAYQNRLPHGQAAQYETLRVSFLLIFISCLFFSLLFPAVFYWWRTKWPLFTSGFFDSTRRNTHKKKESFFQTIKREEYVWSCDVSFDNSIVQLTFPGTCTHGVKASGKSGRNATTFSSRYRNTLSPCAATKRRRRSRPKCSSSMATRSITSRPPAVRSFLNRKELPLATGKINFVLFVLFIIRILVKEMILELHIVKDSWYFHRKSAQVSNIFWRWNNFYLNANNVGSRKPIDDGDTPFYLFRVVGSRLKTKK